LRAAATALTEAKQRVRERWGADVGEEIGPLLLLKSDASDDTDREFVRHLLILHEEEHPPSPEHLEVRREIARDTRRHQRQLRAVERERQQRAAALLAAGSGPTR
jgi:hypothetical protein